MGKDGNGRDVNRHRVGYELWFIDNNEKVVIEHRLRG